MKALPEFQYHSPKKFEEALELLEKLDQANLIAGGTDLIPSMREEEVKPEHIIDIRDIQELNYIEEEEGFIKIGATITINQLVESALIKRMAPALHQAASIIGSPQIRNRGTLTGNICNASPAADSATPLLVFDSQVVIEALGNHRILPLRKFFKGPKISVLDSSEIVREVRFPVPPYNSGSAFHRIGRRKGFTLSIVNAAAYIEADGDYLSDVRIALGAVAPTPIRLIEAEDRLKGRTLDEVRAEAASECRILVKPIDDIRGSAEYRCEMAAVLIERALLDAWKGGAR